MIFMRQTEGWKPASLHPAPDYGRRYLRVFSTPIAESPNLTTPAYNTAGYVKGPFVLLMLEELIGTDAMMHSLRRFRDKHVPGEAADWPDFQRAVQQVTGRDYGWFFDQWLHRSGAPQIRLTEVKCVSADGHCVVTAQVTQAGTPYRLRLPVVLTTAGGEIVRQIMEIRSPTTTLQIMGKSEPVRLELDPDGAVMMAGLIEGEKDDPFAYTFPAISRRDRQ
jgi:aminopeptidase N